jgi:hypothetical protein
MNPYVETVKSNPVLFFIVSICLILALSLFGLDKLDHFIALQLGLKNIFPFHYIVIVIPLSIAIYLGFVIYHSKDNNFGLNSSLESLKPVFQCSLKKDFTTTMPNALIPILKLNDRRRNMFDDNGFRFSKEDGYLLGFSEKLPTGKSNKSVALWFKVDENIEAIDELKTRFLFSYGEAGHSGHNKAFGLQIGIPEIESAHKNNLRETAFGLRVFTYCKNGTSIEGTNGCDYLTPFRTFSRGVWYFTCVVYDDSIKKFKVYLAEKEKNELQNSGFIGDTARDEISVSKTNYVFIGNLVTEIPTLSERAGVDYIALSIDKWVFNGHIREFSIYNRCLQEKEINEIFTKTKELI